MRRRAPDLSDADIGVVAEVISREGWSDLASPPDRHPPRTVAEEAAVMRFAAAAAAKAARPRMSRARARLVMVVFAAGVLGACWYVSPSRTAIGLIGAGLVAFVAHRVRGGGRAPVRAASGR